MGNGNVIVASEASWGAGATTGYRDFEVKNDPMKSSGELLQHNGLRRAGGAPRAAGRRLVKRKSTGVLEVPFMSNGLGILFEAAATTANSAVHSGGTDAYDQVFEFDGGPPLDKSLVVEAYKDRYVSGTYDAFTYRGCRVVSTEITQDNAGFLMVKFTLDGMGVQRQGAAPSRSATVVEPDLIYAFEDATITLTEVGGSGLVIDPDSFGLVLPTDMLVDAWTIRAGTAEVQRVTPSGTWSGGTVASLTVLGVAITGVAYNAPAATWQAAALAAGIPPGHATFSGGPLSTGALDITYARHLGGTPPTATISTTGVTGSTPTAAVTVVTAGVDRGRRQPKGKGTPKPTGTISQAYDSPRYFDAWQDDVEYALTARWEGVDPIEGTTMPSLEISVPSLFWTGEDPTIDPDNPTQHVTPFEITQNAAADPAVTVTIVTSDTDF